MNPELLTRQQRDLLDLFWDTKVTIPVKRRIGSVQSGFEFQDVVRDVRPIDYRIDPGEFAFKLHDKTPGAPLSPVKVNLRDLPDTVVEQVALTLKAVPVELQLAGKPDFCAGIPNAGTPLAKEYARVTGIPLIDIFRKREGNGERTIESHDLAPMGNSSKSVLFIDDVVTGADSKLEAARVAKELGYKVAGVLVLVDREEGGAKVLAENGYPLLYAFTLRRAMQYYWETGKVDTSAYDNYLGYHRLVTGR